MLAVRHGNHPRPVAGEVGDQVQGVLPGHIRILQAMQNVHRPARIERRGADQVTASILDESARDRIRAIALG